MRELRDDKNHKAALQAMQPTSSNGDTGPRHTLRAALLVALLLVLATAGLLAHRRHSTNTTLAAPHHERCGWGTVERQGLCAPDEALLFDWARVQQDRGGSQCQAPDLSEWTCKRYWADELNQHRRLFDDYLGESAQQWARDQLLQEDSVLKQLVQLCRAAPAGATPALRSSENLTCTQLAQLALRDQLVDRRMRVVRDPRRPRDSVVLAWIQPSGHDTSTALEPPPYSMLSELPCRGEMRDFWAVLQSDPVPLWPFAASNQVFQSFATLPTPSETELLRGTPDELLQPQLSSNWTCERRVLQDWHERVTAKLSAALQHRWDARHLRRLFEQLQQRLQRAVQQPQGMRLSNTSRLRLLEKVAEMQLDLVLSESAAPSLEELLPASYMDALQSQKLAELQRALRLRRPQLHHDVLQPAIYYDRYRNALVVHPFMATTPLYPGDTAHSVLARIGWRIAREMYWAMDTQLGTWHDSQGAMQPESWLYTAEERERATATEPECGASRFAFCLVLRLLGEQDFVPSALRNGTAEWAQHVFWSASTTLCHGDSANQALDVCMRSFAPYRATFDCTSTKRIQSSYCPGDNTLWCHCLPYE